MHLDTRLAAKRGFTLIQLSGIVMALGLVTAAMLPSRGGDDVHAKYKVTKERMAKIEKESIKFMAVNSRRPCPASGIYRPGQALFGIENGAEGACTGGNGVFAVASNTVAGTVPIKSLNLPDEYAYDGWGRPITYVVDKRATEGGTCMDTTFTTGELVISDGAAPVDNALALYISHGPDGHGAFLPEGSEVASRLDISSTDTSQISNAGGSIATPSANLWVKKEHTATYDDLLWYSQAYKNTCCLGDNCTTSGTRATRLEGNAADAASENFGKLMAIGNINAGVDSHRDIVVASNNNIYVVLGKATWPTTTNVSTLDGTVTGAGVTGFVISDPDGTIQSLAVGDVTGDGKDDIVWVNNAATPKVRVFRGTDANQPASYSFDIADTAKVFEFSKNPAATGNFKSVAIGDIVGDGIEDIIIGKPNNDLADPGAVYVVNGAAGHQDEKVFGVDIFLDGTDGFTINAWTAMASPNKMRSFGETVGTLEFNDDGYDDIVIGTVDDWNEADDSAFLVLVYGDSSFAWNGETPDAPPGGNFAMYFTGFSPADPDFNLAAKIGVMDINNDGTSDLLWANNDGTSGAAMFYALHGATEIPPSTYLGSETLTADFTATTATGILGTPITQLDSADLDINDDTYADLVIPAPDLKKVFIELGTAAPFSGSLDLDADADYEIISTTVGDNFAKRVAVAAINGDAYPDVLIPADNRTVGGNASAGVVYIIWGRASGWTSMDLSAGTPLGGP